MKEDRNLFCIRKKNKINRKKKEEWGRKKIDMKYCEFWGYFVFKKI